MKMRRCIKKHLSNISGSIHEKIKQYLAILSIA